jgi:hypothetical protein
MNIDAQTVKKIIREELPGLVKSDSEIRQLIVQLSREQAELQADKVEVVMDSRFDRLLEDLRKDREEQARKWDKNQEELRQLREEQNKKWEENREELRQLREEQNKKWEEQNKKWEENQKELRQLREEQNRKWEEQNKKWGEQNKKWEENQEKLERIYQSIEKLFQKHETSIGALGARWGLRTEESFRNALAGILKNLDMEVLHVIEYDDKGEVFGWPEQVELDVIIIDSLLIIGEIKSSVSKPDVYSFYKKAKFYEKMHQREANSRVIISPMVDPHAGKVAEKLGIKIYSYVEAIEKELAT